VQFSSAGSSDPDGDPLSFLWSFGDGTTSTEANPTKIYTEPGVYTARLTVTANGDSAIAQPIVIQVGIPPTLTVAAPTEGQLYRAGDTITYNASATDGAGLDLNDAAIQTVVRLHHDNHYHPFVGPLTGRTGAFTIPTTGEASANTSYELTVTATDNNGLSTSEVVTIRPRTANLTFATSPPGLGLLLDSIPIATPHTVLGVSGFQRELVAPGTAVAADGSPLRFAGWSDGQAIRHTITTPDVDTTYTASYLPDVPFTAEYFANPDLVGPPVLTRQEPQIDYDWGNGSPDPTIPADNFSVRWTKTTELTAGTYQFTTTSDDGIRVFVDGAPVINQWVPQPPTTHTGVIALTEGPHQITVEYFEETGGAVASVGYTQIDNLPPPPPPPGGDYLAEYFANPDLLGPPVLTRQEPQIDYDWGGGSPGAEVPRNNFSARWTTTIQVAAGDYQFTTTTDDGVRLYIDGALVIDQWVPQRPTTHSVVTALTEGPHQIVMEYFEERGGAVAVLAFGPTNAGG
jgi:PKD repeat protein